MAVADHLGILRHDAAMHNVHLPQLGWGHHGPADRLPAPLLAGLDFPLHVVEQGGGAGLAQQHTQESDVEKKKRKVCACGRSQQEPPDTAQ